MTDFFRYSLVMFLGGVMVLALTSMLAARHYQKTQGIKVSFELRGTGMEKIFSLLGLIPSLGFVGVLIGGGQALYHVLHESLGIHFAWFTPKIMAIVSVIVGIFPLAVTALASAIASALKISLNEARVDDYYLAGFNISPVLYAMFMFGWLLMFSFPLGLLGLIGSAIWAWK